MLTASVMHVALTQYDIVHEICSHICLAPNPTTLESALRPYDYWSPGTRLRGCDKALADAFHTLRNLAVTCKTFSGPALDELWAAPPGGLYTVLGLLPSFKLWYPEDITEDTYYVSAELPYLGMLYSYHNPNHGLAALRGPHSRGRMGQAPQICRPRPRDRVSHRLVHV